MAYVFILTITDTANFSKCENYSVWNSQSGAEEHAKLVKYGLIARDKYHGLGDTFNVSIVKMEVNGGN